LLPSPKHICLGMSSSEAKDNKREQHVYTIFIWSVTFHVFIIKFMLIVCLHTVLTGTCSSAKDYQVNGGLATDHDNSRSNNRLAAHALLPNHTTTCLLGYQQVNGGLATDHDSSRSNNRLAAQASLPNRTCLGCSNSRSKRKRRPSPRPHPTNKS